MKRLELLGDTPRRSKLYSAYRNKSSPSKKPQWR